MALQPSQSLGRLLSAKLSPFAFSAMRFASTSVPKRVKFTFMADGQVKHVAAELNKNLMEVAHDNNINLEGACEGSCACATCHIVLSKDVFSKVEPASDDEEDMLDMAHGLTPTSRLGCQVLVSDALEGSVVTVPSAQRNMWVDGAVPTPH